MADPTPTLADIITKIMGGGTTGTIDRAALRQMLAGMGIDVPINTADVEDAAQSLLDAQNALAAAGPATPAYLKPLEDRVQLAQTELAGRANALWGNQSGGNVSENISNYVTSQVNRTQETTSIEQQTTRQYLNVPTPEEFLDTFQNSLATHVKSQVQAGALSQAAGAWILDNPDTLYNDYIAELGSRAAKGEQIFKPVGVTGTPELLGTRPGAAETSQTEQLSKDLAQTQEQAQESATSVQAAAAGAGGGGTTQRQTTTNTQQETATTTQQKALSQLEQTEQIFARPNLTTAYSLSPLEWLQKQAGTSLETLYQGQRGQKRRESETATAPPVILPRRVT